MPFRLFNQPADSEKKLLHAISKDDEQAFESLFNKYKNHVYNVAHKFTHCDISSEEIVQEVFMIIWVKRDALIKIDHFKAYLLTITKHLVYKSLKEKAKKAVLVIPEETEASTGNLEDLLLEKEYGRVLNKAVRRLPQQQQKVYILVKENGLKRDEAANVLNVAPDTIKFHLAQAMKSIRAYCLTHFGANFLLIIHAFISFY